MNNKGINILIASGKTGGHLFPGIAIAQALLEENPGTGILFAGIGTDFETETVAGCGFDYARLYSRPVKGRNPISLVFSLLIIPLSIFQAIVIIKRFTPAMVIGTGGYSSFPMVAGAWLLGIKTGIQEQNTIPGLTNRVLGKIATVIFLNFKNTKLLSEKQNAVHAGNPVRTASTKPRNSKSLSEHFNGFTNRAAEDQFTILVTGGSQGAKSINNSFLKAVRLIKNPDQYNIIHQTGVEDEEPVLEKYSKLNIKNIIVKAFFDDLDFYQDMADLIICRAGAGTISEITLKGIPSILIPYPFAADDHQTQNAKELEKAGGAIVIQDKELSGFLLKKHIESLRNNNDLLEKMGKAARKMAMPGAGKKIAETILKMIAEQGE